MTAPLIFVYGTLRRSCSSGAHRRFLSHASYLGNAHLQAKLFRVSYYPALVLTHEESVVVGEVYALQDELHLLQLDEYEECPQPWHAAQEYRREQVVVLMDNQEYLTVWAYIYNRPTDNLELIPSGDFLATTAQPVARLSALPGGKEHP